MLAHKIAKSVIPVAVRNQVRVQRVEPVVKYIYRRELSQFIKSSNCLSEEKVKETMQEHGYCDRWAGVYTALNGIPAQDYVPEDFFHIHILPRMNNMKFIKAYEDKNIYDIMPLKKYTPLAVARKIEGRYFNADYNPVTPDEIKQLINAANSDLVVKPAIDSGSGKDVWIGSCAEAFQEFIRRPARNDTIVQQRIKGDAFSREINPTSFNTVRAMTAFTGKEYVVVASALRMGRSGSKVDNQNTGGLVLGLQENGDFCEFAYDKYLNRYDRHPDSGFVFKGKTLPGFEDIKRACIDSHKYLPHFGLISWDIAKDNTGAVKIVELNIDWQGINLFQSALGPLFGRHKDEIKKTYNIPDWEG
jgi:hypothetical protein